MENASATIDFTQAAGFTFITYSAEHFATLVRTWTEHPWPISKEGAFTLCGQCGWTIMTGEEELFSIPLPNGNNNGNIRYDFISPDIISGIDIELTPRPPTESIPRTTPVVHRIYNDYLNTISSLYGRPTTSNNEVGQSGSWTLPIKPDPQSDIPKNAYPFASTNRKNHAGHSQHRRPWTLLKADHRIHALLFLLRR